MIKILASILLPFLAIAIYRNVESARFAGTNSTFIVGNFTTPVAASSRFRKNKILDTPPIHVEQNTSVARCFTMCLNRRSDLNPCQSFNYGKGTCSLLGTFMCDLKSPENQLIHQPGYRHYDLSENLREDDNYWNSRACSDFGKCSSRCPKFKIIYDMLQYDEAKLRCEEDGGKLVEPRSTIDHEELLNVAREAGRERYWIGVRRVNNHTFKYLDTGDEFAGIPEIWGEGQPNNSGGIQDCIEMLQPMQFRWNDYECNKTAYAICQYVDMLSE